MNHSEDLMETEGGLMRRDLGESVSGSQHQWRVRRTNVLAHQLGTVHLGRGDQAGGQSQVGRIVHVTKEQEPDLCIPGPLAKSL